MRKQSFLLTLVINLTVVFYAHSANPTVTVTAPAGPTNSSGLNFTVVFSEAVTGFTNDTATDLLLAQTTGGTLNASVSGSGTTYTVTITGQTGTGTVSLTVRAGAAINGGAEANLVSNTAIVTFDEIPPSVTINQAGAQSDPTNSASILFTAVFSEAITGFTNSDITIGGTAGATTAAVSTSDNITWTVTISGMASDGTVTVSIPANAAQDLAGNNSSASTSTDNSVSLDITPPSVTINQAGAQADPTTGNSILFTAIFSEAVNGFTNSDLNISGTAGASTANVTSGDNITWTITVTGVTTDGTVIVTIPAGGAQDAAGNNNTTSTSSDNVVTRDTSPPVTSGAFSPADNATNVAVASTFIITFNKNIKISTTGAITGSQNLIEFYKGGTAQYSISRADVGGTIVISGAQATITLNTDLDLNTAYNIRIGTKVFSDLAGNDFTGISSATTWNFTTSAGVIVNNLSSSKCSGPYSPLSSIVITETAADNIQGIDNGSRTVILGFDSPGFILDPTTLPSITFTAGRDIASISGVSMNFSSLTFTVNFPDVANNNAVRDELDAITISGLKITYDGSSTTPVHIVRTGGTLNVQGITNNTTQFATLTSGTPSANPTLTTTDLTYCLNENISTTTVTANSIAGASYRWYSTASLSSLFATGNPVNVSSELGISTSSAQTIKRYLTITESGKCESNPLEVVFNVVALPGADAGPDQTAANGNTEGCSNQAITLGGSPTLTTTPIAGSYAYNWSSVPALVIASTANPSISINNATGTTTAYSITLTITDPNGCVATDVKNLEIKPAIVPQLTQPNSTVFSSNTAPQLLDAKPPGGIFSGIGVTQTGPTTYKFAASSAYDNTQPLPQSFPIKYTVTSDGCTVTDFPIATITLSNQLFTPIVAQYCSSENPIAEFTNSVEGPQFVLEASSSAYTSMINSVNNWNNSTRFYYAQNLPNWRNDWTPFTGYAAGDLVRDGNEIYLALAANTTIPPFIDFKPSTHPGTWQLQTNLLKVDFNGTIRNFYEGYYNGNVNGKTIAKKTNTYDPDGAGPAPSTFNRYELLTNINYNQCGNCDYTYPAFYLEFKTTNDIQYVMQWNAGFYYYPNDVVFFAGTYYRQVLTYNDNPYWTIGVLPNSSSSWQAIGSTWDTGYNFVESGKSGVFATGQYVTINKNPQVQFSGLVSGLVNAGEFCSEESLYQLTGTAFVQSQTLTGVGTFDMSYTGATGSFSNLVGLTNGTSGQATFNTLTAYNGSTNTTSIRPFYVRYLYDPGTQGSAAQACIGQTTQNVNVNLSPTPAFTNAPVDNRIFCPAETPVDIEVTGTATALPFSIALTGPGVTDKGDATGKFDPGAAIATLQTINNTTYTYSTRPINFNYINSKITDANGCTGTISKPLTVNPIPPATISPFPPNVCYTTSPFTIDGQQSSAFYSVVYKDVINTQNFGSIGSPVSDLPFNPKTFFDDAVNLGANKLATLSFDIIYSTYDPDDCVNTRPPITIKVAPQIPVTISGITDMEEICSNINPLREISLSPSGGNLVVSRNGTPLPTQPSVTNGKFIWNNIPLDGGNYKFDYDVVTGNGCSNPTSTVVKVFPSPVASFTAPPKCDGDIISFNADGTNNGNGAPNYQWTFEGNQVSGQNVQYKFSGTGTYTVNLNVAYPAMGTSNIVCSSQSTLDQFVGLIPKVDFKVSDVCLGDATKFEYSDQVTPISEAKWDFADPDNIPYGTVNQTIPASLNNSGTHGNPIHSFPSSGSYLISLTGRTSAQSGSCENTKTKMISILQKLSADPLNIYSMKSIDGEKGFWVVEDKNGNSTWEFAQPSGSKIVSAQNAWITKADGVYKANDQSYVNSPCLDITAFSRPVVSLQYWGNTPVSDGAVLQYSTDGGQTWPTLGSLINNNSSGQNWYNIVGVASAPGDQTNFGWSRNNMTDWEQSKHSLNEIVGSRDKVRFRLAFASVNTSSAPIHEGFAFNDFIIEDRNRTILVENFTNLNATGSAANNSNFRSFQSALSDIDIVKMQYHTSFPTPDNLSNQNISDPNARAAFYGLTQPPKAYIDGFTDGTFSGNWATQYFDLRSLSASKASISATISTVNPELISGNIQVKANAAISGNTYIVLIAVIERNVGTEDYIVRKMLPNASGTNLPALSQHDIVNIPFDWVPDSRKINNGSNLMVVAFIQELQGKKEIMQSYITNIPTVTTVTAIEPISGDHVIIYPNPANDSFVIELPTKTDTRLSVHLIDQVGRLVHESTFETGEQTKAINTQELAGGIYVVQIGAGKSGVVRKKMMIVHKN